MKNDHKATIMNTKLITIAQKFQIEGEIVAVENLGEGFINDTFIIKTADGAPNYILQRKNKRIFSPIPAMMGNIQKVCTHIKKKVEKAGGDPMREAMTIIPAHDGKLYFVDEDEDAAEIMIKKSKQMGVPVTEILGKDGKETIVVGFDKPKLIEALGIAE